MPRAIERLIERFVRGTDAQTRATLRSRFWARAQSDSGSAEAWLETDEGYELTAQASVHSVERVLETKPVGLLTPSQAFGPDFVLELPNVQRLDALPAA
jgi:short subunit dehydrogenase-like uncharacterized protein